MMYRHKEALHNAAVTVHVVSFPDHGISSKGRPGNEVTISILLFNKYGRGLRLSIVSLEL